MSIDEQFESILRNNGIIKELEQVSNEDSLQAKRSVIACLISMSQLFELLYAKFNEDKYKNMGRSTINGLKDLTDDCHMMFDTISEELN